MGPPKLAGVHMIIWCSHVIKERFAVLDAPV